MKKIFGLIIFLFAMVITQGQTVDEIVNKHIEAVGGKEKLLALKSIKMQGSMSVQGYDLSITSTRLHQKGTRIDFSLMGTENYQFITPEKGIVYMPIQGMSEPAEMDEDQFKAGQTQLDVQGLLVNYKEKGTTVELLGSEKNGTVDNYKLKITIKNGFAVTYFIGKTDYMLNKSVSKRNINGEETDWESTYSNYKKNADGYLFAYAGSSLQGDIIYDKIETNVPVDENIFK